jgi:hypothetical protein
MTSRTDFTDEEWAALRRGLVAGEEAVRAAGPSGWFGRFKESRALKREWKRLEERSEGSDLVRDLIAEEGRAPIASVRLEEGATDAFIADSLEACRAAARILAAKVEPVMAAAYVDVALELAETAALAAPEQGSPEPVSHAESIVLRRVAEALGRHDYEAPGRGPLEVDDSLAVEEAYSRQTTN